MSSLTARLFAETLERDAARPDPHAENGLRPRAVCEQSSEFSGCEAALTEFPQTEAKVSDETLMSGVCAGDTEALGCLFRRYARLVRSVAYKVLRDTFEADDLLQEIFLLINRKCASFDSSKSPARFWILQMTYHRAISRRRYLSYRHFYTRVDLDDAESSVVDPRSKEGRFEESIDLALGKSDVHRLFESLSENQRLTLKLHFFEGYTLDEIAAMVGQTRENVRHHYFRGLDKMRKQLVGKEGRR